VHERGDRAIALVVCCLRLNRDAGVLVRSSLVTDVVTLGIGLSLGALLGAVSFPLGPVRMTLGPSVGLLLIGIALGTLRTRFPQLGGPFPEPARKLLEDLGLSVFVAILGLTSGASVIASLLSGGVVVIIVGALIVGLVPPFIAWVVGLYILRMNTALLLGAVAGGSASAAALNAAQEVSGSTVPAIAYPVAFAISNILFTLLSYIAASFG
jgi:putative transport protein